MIVWHYCPQKYIINNQPSDETKSTGHNFNFYFGQENSNKKENWEDDEDEKDDEPDDYMRGSEIHFWMGHSNFDITKEIRDKFDKFDGIEYFRLVTRYCFIISPGMLFSFSDIRKQIESDFCDKINHEEIIKVLKDKYKHWIIYINGKGEIEYASSSLENCDKDERLIEDSAYFKLSMKKNGGQIIESN